MSISEYYTLILYIPVKLGLSKKNFNIAQKRLYLTIFKLVELNLAITKLIISKFVNACR